MTFNLQIDDNYGIALLSAVILSFETILIGFLFPGRMRGKVFTKEFLKENFGEEHLLATGEEIEKQSGYPDMGSGRFSAKLSYADWIKFNRAQRVHLNLVEQIASYLCFIAVGGIKYAIPTAVFGYLLCIGRLLYGFYLNKDGPLNKGRLIGVLLCDVCIVALFIISIMTCASIIQNKY